MGKIVAIEKDAPWAPTPNEVAIVLDETLPPIEAITSAFALVFHGDQLLMTHLVKRGWDIPGGHVEPNETPLESAKRELL